MFIASTVFPTRTTTWIGISHRMFFFHLFLLVLLYVLSIRLQANIQQFLVLLERRIFSIVLFAIRIFGILMWPIKNSRRLTHIIVLSEWDVRLANMGHRKIGCDSHVGQKQQQQNAECQNCSLWFVSLHPLLLFSLPFIVAIERFAFLCSLWASFSDGDLMVYAIRIP